MTLTHREKLYTLIAYGLLLALAVGFRVAMFDRYLPMLDYSDESNMFLFSQALRPEGAPLADDYGAALTGDWLQGYPPLYGWLGVWTQRGMESARSDFLFPGDYIGMMRVWSVVANGLTVAVLLALGWRIGQPLGTGWAGALGWFVALTYALNPWVVDVGILAIPDSLIPLGVALTLWGVAEAIHHERPWWLLVSLVGAVMTIYLKYSLVFMLWPFFVGVFWLLRGMGWRRMWPTLSVLVLVAVITAGYLVFGYGALGLENQEAAGFRESGLQNMVNLSRNLTNLRVGFDVSMGYELFGIVALMGGVMGWLAYKRGCPVVAWRWVWVVLPVVVGNVLLTSSVVYADPIRGGYGRVRYLFPSGIALSVVFALAVVQYLIVFRELAQDGMRRPLVAIVGVFTSGLMLVPFVQADVALVQQYARTDSNLLVWQYSDASLPNDGLILTPRESRTHKIWNRPYSGYDGQTPFVWTHDANPADGTVQDAFDAGIRYLVHTEGDAYDTPAMRPFLDDLFLLKTIVADGEQVTGETTFIYRILPPQVMTDDVLFGESVRLVGYDINGTVFGAGDTLMMRPYWQALTVPNPNLSLFVHLYREDTPTELVAQWDGAPAKSTRLTGTWDDPDEIIMGTDAMLALPDELPAGDYTLAFGLYDYTTGVRLSVGDSDRFSLVVQVE